MDVFEVYKKIASRALQQGNRKLADALRNPKRRPQQKVTELFAEEPAANQPMPAVRMSPPPTTQKTPSVPRQNVLLEFMQEYAKDVMPPQMPQESREEMQAGGMAGEPFAAPQEAQEQAPMADAGATVVGDPREGVTEEQSIADDVAVDVPEGSFVVNQPAVEQAGLKDLIKKVEDAYDTANREGIDISSESGTMSKEDTVNLLVSRGELIISPEIAKIIGYETLEKINNRGKEEVARRQQEAEQQQQAQPQNQQQSPLESELVRAARGGFISK